jgi:hypothetical protein
MNSPISEVKFWKQVIGDAKRTVICSQVNVERIRGFIAERGLSGLLTVQESPLASDSEVYVVDEGSLTATLNREMLRMPRLRRF